MDDDAEMMEEEMGTNRGSGMSYAALWLAQKTAKEIAKRKGGKWQDYFSKNGSAALETPEHVTVILGMAYK